MDLAAQPVTELALEGAYWFTTENTWAENENPPWGASAQAGRAISRHPVALRLRQYMVNNFFLRLGNRRKGWTGRC